METKYQKKRIWLYTASLMLLLSVISSFLPVLSYWTPEGSVYRYNLIQLIQGEDFTREVLYGYKDTVYWEINEVWVTFFALISVLSLLCAVIGLITLRQQRPNIMQFWLTMAGLAGTSLPALLVLFAVLFFQKGFPGTLSPGLYPLIAPAAAIISVAAVYRRKNKYQEELRRELEAEGKIWQAGESDLY